MIEFDEVELAFGDVKVLRGLSFTAHDGAVTGFVGANGAGKSTAFKVLLELLRADGGEARIDGLRYRDHHDPGRAVGAYLGPQWLPGSMTGQGYLNYTADLLGASRGDVSEYLSVVGLAESAGKKVGSYSLGMRQRLGIAAALIGEPANLVLDEPVNGLDVEGVRWLRDYLRAAAVAGRCVLLSSHLMSELELVADDIVMLGAGRISRSGSIDAVRAPASDTVVVVSDDNVALSQRLHELGARTELIGGELHVLGRTVNWVAGAVAVHSVPLVSVARRVSRLEDVYLDQVRQDEEGARL